MADDAPPPSLDPAQGLLYAHTRANLNTIEIVRALAESEALLELLVERGVIDREDLDARRSAVEARLRREFVDKGMSVAIQEHARSKYEYDELPEIDCANRVDLCGAACCRLRFALSKEDVEESVVRWDLGHPYMIAHTPAGRCVHLDAERCSCGVYQHRPVPCRSYDCRRDRRVWLDFEERVPNPTVMAPEWPQGATEAADRAEAEATDGAGGLG